MNQKEIEEQPKKTALEELKEGFENAENKIEFIKEYIKIYFSN